MRRASPRFPRWPNGTQTKDRRTLRERTSQSSIHRSLLISKWRPTLERICYSQSHKDIRDNPQAPCRLRWRNLGHPDPWNWARQEIARQANARDQHDLHDHIRCIYGADWQPKHLFGALWHLHGVVRDDFDLLWTDFSEDSWHPAQIDHLIEVAFVWVRSWQVLHQKRERHCTVQVTCQKSDRQLGQPVWERLQDLCRRYASFFLTKTSCHQERDVYQL